MAQHKKPTKSDNAFVLAVDEDRCEVFQVMVTCLMNHLPNFILSHPDRAGVVIPALKELVSDIANKQHEMGWCKDKNCEWSTHKHE